MKIRDLGATGLRTSIVGFGAGALGEVDDAAAEKLVRAALDLGITLIDTARSYGSSEERLGRFLGEDRKRVVLSTKGGYGVEGAEDWTHDCVRLGVERALRTLRTDVIDLFHLHSCPREVLERGDVIRALEEAKRDGKIRVAAYSGENEALEWATASGRFGSVQTSVNIVDQRSLDASIPAAARAGVGVIAKRPLANAVWRFSERPFAPDMAEYWTRFRELRLETRDDWQDVAARFAAHAPGVASILVGTRSVEHLEASVAAAARGPLPADVLEPLQRVFAERGSDWRGLI